MFGVKVELPKINTGRFQFGEAPSIATANYHRFIDPDPVHWIETHFRVPETADHRLILDDYQRECIWEGLRMHDGQFDYSIIIWSDIKKSIKSTIAAAVALWWAWQCEWGSILVIANDLKQADSRVGYYIRRSIELNRDMRDLCKIVAYKITLPNKATIENIPIDPTGEAGSNADAVFFSELWGAHQKAQQKMWTESTLSPTKFGRSFRWIETYAGFTGESPLLEQLYETGVKAGAPLDFAADFDPPLPVFRNQAARMLCLWNTTPRLPWQTPAYYAQEESVLLEGEFRRVHRNEWASSEETFVPLEWWNACRSDMQPLEANQTCVMALDAAVSGDCFGVVMLSGRGGGEYDVRYARKWTPPKGGKLLFKGTPEQPGPEDEIRRLLNTYNVAEVAYDPMHLEDMAGRMTQELLGHFYTFNQGAERLIADNMLRDNIRDRRLHHSGESELTEHIQNANAKIEGEAGKLRIVKKSESKKIDLAVCLSMALNRAVYWGL